MNKNIKNIFFVSILILLLLGVSAVTATDNDKISNDLINESPQTATDAILTENVKTASDNNVETNTKNMKKTDKNIKTSTKTVEVNNYDELGSSIDSAVSNSENDNYVISLNNGTYQITNYLICRSGTSTPNITIQANNQTLSTQPNTAYYVMFNNGCNITINDATITHHTMTYCNLELNNVVLDNVWTIYNNANITIKNSTINNQINNLGTVIFDDYCSFGDNFNIGGNIIINDTNKIAPYLNSYNGNYTLENITLNSYKSNYGNLTLKNCTINTEINNNGVLNISDDCILGENAFFTGNGNIIFNDMNKLLPHLGTYNGNYTLENITLNSYRTNNGNLTILHSIITGTIYNQGNLTINMSNITDTIYNNDISIIDNSNMTCYFVNNCNYSIIKNSIITNRISNNQGNITFNNVTLNCSIQNDALLIFDDDCIFYDNFRLTGNGQILINDTSKIIAFLDIYTGNITLENRTITSSKTNYGNLTIKNSTMNYLYNNGNVTIINSNITTISMGVTNISINIINSTVERVNFNGYDHSNINVINSTARIDGSTDVNMTINNSNLTSFMNFGYALIDNSTLDYGSNQGSGTIIMNSGVINGYIDNYGNFTIGDAVTFTENAVLSNWKDFTVNDMNKVLPYLERYNEDCTLENITLNNFKVNNANLLIRNSTFNAQITNNGNITFEDDVIFGEDCVLSGNGIYIINDTSKIAQYLSVFNGNYTINNLNITNSKINNGNLTLINSQINNQFTNNGEMIIDFTNITNRFINNGTLTINNSQINTTSFNNNGNLTIINSNINKGINNDYGKTVTIKNSIINTTISNNGNLIIDDDCILGENTLITGNGRISINDTNKIAPYLTIYNGNYTLENMTISSSKTNRGNLTMNNVSFGNFCSLENYGNITINDSTLDNMNYIDNYGQIILNNSTINCYIWNEGTVIIDQTSTIGDEFYIEGSGLIITNNTAIIELLKQQNIYIGENTIENTNIDYTITNYGTLYLKNDTINSQIINYGEVIIDNETIFGENCYFNGNGKITINDITRIIPYIQIINGTYKIENMEFNRTYGFDGNITLINCTIKNPSNWNYGTLTLKNTTINMTSPSYIWLYNYGLVIIEDCKILNGTLNNIGDVIYGQIPETLNPKEFNEDQTIENMTFILKSTNNANLTLNNCNITATLTNNGNLTLINSTISTQLINYANITFINCSLSNNNITTTSSKTDGYLLNNQANATFIDCIMENNTFLAFGYDYFNNPTYYTCNGAIYNNGNITLLNSTFINNTVGCHTYTGGNRISTGSSTIINGGNVFIENCNFTDNYAGHQAGVLSASGGEIKNSIFINNSASAFSGALSINNILVDNCTFLSNNQIREYEVGGVGAVVYGGGAISTSNSNITNCRFINNTAKYIAPSMAGVLSSGGAINLQDNNSIINCNFTNNSGDHGSAIANGIFTYGSSNSNNNTVTGCIFEENFGNPREEKSAIINIGQSSSLNLINNTFKNNYNTSYIIYNEVGYNTTFYGNEFLTTHIYDEIVKENNFINNKVNSGTLFSLEPDRITKTANTYQNTTINDTITLDIPDKIYTQEPITITGTYILNNPQDYDDNILDQNKFEVYINGVLNQTINELTFNITPTAGNMIITVHPTISQTQRTQLLKSTTLSYLTITPENYNTYIYEGTLISVGKDTKIIFNGEFTDKGEIYIDTNDILIDGTNATFTNSIFILDSENITIQNMTIYNYDTNYPISNYKDNNIISNNNITLKNTNGKTAAIYNTASNTTIANNILLVEAPAGDIDFVTSGVASSQAILLLGGNNNIIQNNSINIKAISNSLYGTLEAITNSNNATNTIITQNKINISNASFNYAIDCLSNVENITITENTITVTGERYCDGIQVGNNANNILIDNNNITCICLNTTQLDSEGAITYGVIGTSMGGDITINMTITNNNINLTGTANYGIELYKVNTTEIHNNTITVNGPFSMGIGYAYSPNGNVTGNTITITGDSTTPINQITEEFRPENTGIRVQNGTMNVSITDNTITTSDIGGQDTTIHTDSNNVTITNNKLISSQGYGSESIIAPTNAKIENNTIETTTTIEVPETTLTNTPVTLTATVTDEFENPINTGTITFAIGDEIIATAQVTNGISSTTITFTQEEDNTITATYTPTSTGLTTSTAEASISIQKPQTQLNIEDITLTAGETVTLTATITDQLQNNINGGKVTFKVNGKTVKDANGKVIYAKVVDGIATAQYTVPQDYSGKEINITATYSGTSTYNKETVTITTTVTPKELTLTTSDVTATAGQTVTLTATLSDNTINTGKIVFKVNGKTVKDTNGKVIYAKVVNGTVSVEYTLPESMKAKEYTITAVYMPTSGDRLEDNATLTVVN